MPTEIHQEVMFQAKPKDVYSAIMNSKKHTAFTKNGSAEGWKKMYWDKMTEYFA